MTSTDSIPTDPDAAVTHEIIVENPASVPQINWATFGVPDHVAVKGTCFAVAPDGRRFPLVMNGNTAHVRATLKAKERLRCKVDLSPIQNVPFRLHPWVVDEPERNVPRFKVMVGDTAHYSLPTPFVPDSTPDGPSRPAFIRLAQGDDARLQWHFRTQIPNIPLLFEGWLHTYTDQAVVEFEIRVSYGTTAAGQDLQKVLGSVSMIVGEKPVIDHRMPKGLHAPVWRTDIVPGKIYWEAELATPRQWLRARTVEVTGALLCLPPEDRFGQLPGNPELENLRAREECGIQAMASKAVWDGHWLSFGTIPSLDPALAKAIQDQRKAAWLTREGTMGDEYMTRPYAQPPNAGQTGEQPDFGASRCEHVIAMEEPWGLHDLRWNVQAWMLRPYANREPDGYPVMALMHPGAKLWNLREDYRHFGTDNLGWEEIGWIGDWDTSDSQHRSDNMLYGMFALTRSPSLERTIRDMLELQKMELYQGTPPLGSGVGSPRNLRVLHALCHADSLHFQGAEALIRRMCDDTWQAASLRLVSSPSDYAIRVLSTKESKYGWTWPDGRDIRAWLPWQEGIAVMALYAAWKRMRIQSARDLVILVAETLTRFAFFQENGRWYCCYGVRVDDTDPSKPMPPSSYTATLPSNDVFVFGIQRWVLPALRILVREQPHMPVSERAREILAAFGPASSWDDSAWSAV